MKHRMRWALIAAIAFLYCGHYLVLRRSHYIIHYSNYRHWIAEKRQAGHLISYSFEQGYRSTHYPYEVAERCYRPKDPLFEDRSYKCEGLELLRPWLDGELPPPEPLHYQIFGLIYLPLMCIEGLLWNIFGWLVSAETI